ncbi:glycosyl hydrolase family 18 protein [Legionella clemsonensis]|uniref:chitinase n=1 Tax=Legionella clemsonensis TaxID=1867846 RepID=A0A222P3A9_9GAMM|nr:glycosyl hydrolase family 18 protein [Legionella clemsonensis]ASQ46323.1 Chitinase D precursor [Legionella clemsonensis]
MRYLLPLLGALSFATATIAQTINPSIAQPTSCINAGFTSTGNQHWKSIVLKLTNNCTQAVDFQNSTVTFQTSSALNTNFWGDFSPLSYPDNELMITSQPQSDGKFLATFHLHFPDYPGANSILPIGSSIFIKYGAEQDHHIEDTTLVYLNSVVESGSIKLNNPSVRPGNVSQHYALVHLLINGQIISDVQLPWQASKVISHLAPGNYTIAAESIVDNEGNKYQGQATPSLVTVSANQTVNSTIQYSLVPQAGKLIIHLENLPDELSGYGVNPTVLITQTDSGNSQSRMVTWGSSETISQLKEGGTYTFFSPLIHFNGYNCSSVFNPTSVIANASNPPVTNLSYQCIEVIKDTVTLNVSGAPASLSSLKVSLTPNDNSPVIVKTIDLLNGAGSASVELTSGVIYTLSSENVSGYTVNFSPQPLTATANAVATITLSPVSSTSGRIISYLPGWKTPPSAQSLANAGYTHAMVAFGVFSTSNPGVITPAFDTITREYVQSLHQAGIKVILSLGGALTSLPNTTVDFHQVLAAATSVDSFKQTFINSLTELIIQYEFDGFDIDIEHGVNAGGTFSQPQGDIAVLASIINTMYSQNPSLLITLTPQVANVAATSGFDATWGNYASLIMQTHNSLAWVGIQLYNTGCAFGIDQVCYGPSPTSTPDFSVAMATDLLEDWPAIVNGRNTGFQPYISYLKPSQVVIGYPAPNASGASDGWPVTPTSTIKRAIQCLRTATVSSLSCDSYVPPKAYSNIGGVFNWEITYDQDNNFRFATELKNCILNGQCN